MKEHMKPLAASLWATAGITNWIGGIYLAASGWATFFAVVIPPYAWYLVAKRLLQTAGCFA